MRILFLSWGILPYKTGGLEVVTYYYLKYLDDMNNYIDLFIPFKDGRVDNFIKLRSSNIIGLNINFSKSYNISYRKSIIEYKKNIMDYKKAVYEYKNKILEYFNYFNFNYDVIYCYDWLTIPAAIELKKKYNVPLVIHFHSTAYDRVGGNEDLLKYLIDSDYGIELEGIKYADKIIVVSKRMKDILIKYYNADGNKIDVVYNAVEDGFEIKNKNWYDIKKKYKIVLYLGRMTMHKGPDWLLKAAKKVLEKNDKVLFIFAGTGEMLEDLIKLSAQLKISKNVIFTGWIDDNLANILYDLADIFVLPSVSEPFGLTPFEALKYNNAIIITKQSGVSEVLKNAAKVDFWDVNKMADYILMFLNYDKAKEYEIKNCLKDIYGLNWRDQAKKVNDILISVINNRNLRINIS